MTNTTHRPVATEDARAALEAARATVQATLKALDAQLAALPLPPAEQGSGGPELPRDLIEVAAAAERFNIPADTIRKWLRSSRDGLGVRCGGRWLVNLAALRRHIGQG